MQERKEQAIEWPTERRVGRVTEIAVMCPIRLGCPPGERRTYEERLRATIASMTDRHVRGLPIELDRVPTIHFGRLLIVRPEQYLSGSNVPGLKYDDEDGEKPGRNAARASAKAPPSETQAIRAHDEAAQREPRAFETYAPMTQRSATGSPDQLRLRSWLVTLVEFDGDLKVYMRDVAKFLNTDFDAIYQNCEGFSGTQSFEKFWQWLQRYRISVDLFYATYPDLSVARIKHLEAFKRRFDAFVERVRPANRPPAASMDELFDDFLRENQQYAQNFPTPSGLYAPRQNG